MFGNRIQRQRLRSRPARNNKGGYTSLSLSLLIFIYLSVSSVWQPKNTSRVNRLTRVNLNRATCHTTRERLHLSWSLLISIYLSVSSVWQPKKNVNAIHDVPVFISLALSCSLSVYLNLSASLSDCYCIYI